VITPLAVDRERFGGAEREELGSVFGDWSLSTRLLVSLGAVVEKPPEGIARQSSGRRGSKKGAAPLPQATDAVGAIKLRGQPAEVSDDPGSQTFSGYALQNAQQGERCRPPLRASEDNTHIVTQDQDVQSMHVCAVASMLDGREKRSCFTQMHGLGNGKWNSIERLPGSRLNKADRNVRKATIKK
jgi:hypothetical protein